MNRHRGFGDGHEAVPEAGGNAWIGMLGHDESPSSIDLRQLLATPTGRLAPELVVIARNFRVTSC
jgi:hypothetical protein